MDTRMRRRLEIVAMLGTLGIFVYAAWVGLVRPRRIARWATCNGSCTPTSRWCR
jgi:hypothetical protein